ncbi:BLOC-1-related complex subunit 8 homolog [Condylostylus longicornis]|uniref:BLOC-1-related complex subunit 8 homolog n=1 Tax=Condylostylus longicornis TaxID=2530218 RepID=UPI00244DF13D|nr:BLOC-1-related complex subunit 8 homolog [Condylostylus longicornis]
MNTMNDKYLTAKVGKTSEKIVENIHIVANEPSMAFYRIQEHVRKVLPPITEKRTEVLRLQNDLRGNCFDVEYGVSAVKSIEKANKSFSKTEELLKTAIFLKQQLKYEGSRQKPRKKVSHNSVYKRFSAHIALDLPDLSDISGVVRETSNKVESMTKNITNQSELQRSHTTLH